MSTQNVLQGILSQKIVQDGEGGYAVRTDIVNVDNVVATGAVFGAGGILATTFITESLTINGQTPTISVEANDSGPNTLTIDAPLSVNGPLNLNGNNINGLTNLTAEDLNSFTLSSNSVVATTLTTPNIIVSGTTPSISTQLADRALLINAPIDLKNNILSSTGGASQIRLGSTLNLNNNSITTTAGSSINFISPINLNSNNLANVQNVNLNAMTFSGSTANIYTRSPTTPLFINAPLRFTTTQAGQIICVSGTNPTTITGITDVTATSVVIVTPTSQPDGRYWVTTSTGTITLNLETAQNITFNYFVARY
jgi:hypothetical protein